MTTRALVVSLDTFATEEQLWCLALTDIEFAHGHNVCQTRKLKFEICRFESLYGGGGVFGALLHASASLASTSATRSDTLTCPISLFGGVVVFSPASAVGNPTGAAPTPNLGALPNVWADVDASLVAIISTSAFISK